MASQSRDLTGQLVSSSGDRRCCSSRHIGPFVSTSLLSFGITDIPSKRGRNPNAPLKKKKNSSQDQVRSHQPQCKFWISGSKASYPSTCHSHQVFHPLPLPCNCSCFLIDKRSVIAERETDCHCRLNLSTYRRDGSSFV